MVVSLVCPGTGAGKGPSASPAACPLVWGVKWPLQPCLTHFFMSAPWVGSTSNLLLGKGKGRGSLYPAKPLAAAFTSATDCSEVRITASFPSTLLVLKTEHRKARSLLKNVTGGSCKAPEHREGYFLLRLETWHSAPSSASLRGLTLLCCWL